MRPKSRIDLSWRRIGAVTVAVVVLISVITIVLRPAQKRETQLAALPMRSFEGDFVLTSAFAEQNDLAVLRAAFVHACEAKSGYQVLSDKALDRFDVRTGTSLAQIPAAFGCRGLRLTQDSMIEKAFDQHAKATKDFKRSGGWGGFYDQFPKASALVSISMPVYTDGGTRASVYADYTSCSRCGAGWKILLVKTNGNWVVQQRIPRWIT